MTELLWRRSLAYALDCLVLFAVFAPLSFLGNWLLGRDPGETPVYRTLLVYFSLPGWTYFTVCDALPRGSTLGKRWLGLRVSRSTGERVSPVRALMRTAAKLLPWELVHLGAFGLSTDPAAFTPTQTAVLAAGNLLWLAYFVLVALTGGRRSVHDFVVATEVAFGPPRQADMVGTDRPQDTGRERQKG